MSNYYTAEQAVAVAARLVSDSLHLTPTVDRSFEGEFEPGSGSTVHVRVPAGAIARDRDLDDVTSAVIFDELAETSIPISLDTHAVSGVILSEADLSLRIEDFAAQVLIAQTDAVADRVERAIATALAAVPETTGIAFDEAAPEKLFTALRRALRERGVDFGTGEPVFALAGSNVVDALLDSGALDFSKTGDADSLRNGSVGRIRGFQVLESSRIADDEVVAYPQHGVHLAVRPPAVPLGAAFGSIVRADDRTISVRYLRDYDSTHTADRSLVSTFVGAKVMPAYRVTRDYAAGTATRSEITGGHVVRVDTSA